MGALIGMVDVDAEPDGSVFLENGTELRVIR